MKNNNGEVVDRQELKVSLKVFLYSSAKEDISGAVERGISKFRQWKYQQTG